MTTTEKPKLFTPVTELLTKEELREANREAGIYTLAALQEDLEKTKVGLRTGFKKLDEHISIEEGSLTFIAGRPSTGKTTTKLNMLINMIEIYPKLTFSFFSYEENIQKIALKLIYILSGHVFQGGRNIQQLQNYIKLKSTKVAAIQKAAEKFNSLIETDRLKLFSKPYNVQELAPKIKILADNFNTGAVFIDYVQKIKNEKTFGTRQLELQKTSEILLETAKTACIPLILGCQLGRNQGTKDKLSLDNMREAGDLENDAAIVLGINNPAMEKGKEEMTKEEKEDTFFLIMKNRDGERGIKIPIAFDVERLKMTGRE